MGGVNIPLEANNLQPQQPIDPLQEQMRAAQLQQTAAQTQGIKQANQAQGLQLKDEQLRRQLAPQYVQKDSSGKITGFDNEGLYGDMLAHGADPATIQAMRMKNAELQKAMIGLGDAQLEHSQKIADTMGKSLESIQEVQDQEKKAAGPQASAPPATPQVAIPPGVTPPQIPLQAAQNPAPVAIGSSPAGTPESFAPPPDGTVPTATESAVQSSAANAPRPIMPGAQKAYHQALVRLSGMGMNISQLPPVLNDESDLEQAEASIGQYHELHKQQLADAKTLAETHAQQGKGDLDSAEAGLKNIELNLSKNATPGTFDQQIDGLKLPPDQAAMLKEQINQTLARGDVPTAKKIVSSALENVQGVNKDIAVATNPQIQQGKIDVAAAEVANRPGTNMLIENGKNPDGSPHMSLLNTRTGAISEPTGNGAATIQAKGTNAPTQQMKTSAFRANTALAGIPDVINDVDRMKDKLGPVMGRWNDFMQGKVGADDPDFAGLRADMTMLSTAVTLAHAQGRMSDSLKDEFGSMLNQPKQSPENIKAVLGRVQTWMQRQANINGPNAGKAPSTQSTAPPQFSHISASGKFGWDGKQWVPIPGK